MTTSTTMSSTNWSGAVIQATAGHSLGSVSAQWMVPAVTQVPLKGVGTSDLASWVGLDGFNSADVAQAGIQETVSTAANGKTTVNYSAWDEWYPAGSNTISALSFKVDPGDTVGITVETSGAGSTKATFLFDDETTRQTFQTSLTALKGVSLTGNSAEWVVETPEYSNGYSTLQPPLADFLSTPIVFDDASAMYSNSIAASLLGADTIGMESYGIPGLANYTQEAYGSVSAATDSISVMEDNYWSQPINRFLPHGYFI